MTIAPDILRSILHTSVDKAVDESMARLFDVLNIQGPNDHNAPERFATGLRNLLAAYKTANEQIEKLYG